MCSTQINLCILASAQTISRGRPAGKTIPGWNEQVKSYQERSLFWHWILVEAGKPVNGYVYTIMKRTRHQYHYAIRCAIRNNTEIIRTELADNMSNSKDLWKELQKIDPASNSISNTVDQAVVPEQITEKILTKYEELFNSVPTSDSEVAKLQNVLADISFDTRIIPDILDFVLESRNLTRMMENMV